MDGPDDQVVNVYPEKKDEFEQLIFEKGLRIEAVYCHKHLDLLLVLLNNKRTINLAISDFERLKHAGKAQLINLKLIADSTGIHWPDLDEDISLKSILKYELAHFSDCPFS